MTFQPILPAFVLIILAVLFLATGVYLVLNKTQPLRVRQKWILRTITALFTVLLLARPGVLALQEQQTYTNQLDVYFVVDVTSSMTAEDWETGSEATRLDAAKTDVRKLVDTYPDARYSLIASDTQSNIVIPLTRDSTAFVTGLDYLSPEITRNSQGSNPGEFLKLLGETLTANAETNPDRAALVFVFSDGEITNDTISYESDPNISSYISAGGVLGYGTPEGGKMKVQQGYYISNDKGYIKDPTTGQDALSKIDETNLENIASTLNVSYVHRTPGEDYKAPGTEGSLEIGATKSIKTIVDYSWVVALGLILLITIDTGLLVNKYRKEKIFLNGGK